MQDEIRRQTIALARELGVIGLMNVQFAVQRTSSVYVLEVNPRASRTVPFVSKAIGVPLAKIAARVMAGKTLAELGFTREIVPTHVSVKEAVFPFVKFPGVDTMLGPEMKSTGEVMGIGPSFGVAFAKARARRRDGAAARRDRVHQRAGRGPRRRDRRPRAGCTSSASASSRRAARPAALHARRDSGRDRQQGAARAVRTSSTRSRRGGIALVINTPRPDAQELRDSFSIRRTALERKIPYFTTIAGAVAAAEAITAMASGPLGVKALQEYHAEMARSA